MVLILLVIAAGGYSYETGRRLARVEVSALTQQVSDLTRQVGELQTAATAAQQTAQAATAEAQSWQSRYQADVPSGEDKAIFGKIKALMAAGVPPERIDLLLDATTKAQKCGSEVETKRFGVKSPLSQDPNQPINIGGAFLITAQGESALDGSGSPASWFDPAKPVTVSFIEPGGATTTAEGVLPINKSIARGNTEYRFTVNAADVKGYARVTLEQCSL
jgi:hypothetical protein